MRPAAPRTTIPHCHTNSDGRADIQRRQRGCVYPCGSWAQAQALRIAAPQHRAQVSSRVQDKCMSGRCRCGAERFGSQGCTLGKIRRDPCLLASPNTFRLRLPVNAVTLLCPSAKATRACSLNSRVASSWELGPPRQVSSSPASLAPCRCDATAARLIGAPGHGGVSLLHSPLSAAWSGA